MELIKKISSKISKTLLLAIFILALGGTITYYQTKLNSLEVPDKIKVVVASKKISKGDEITGSHLKEKVIYEPDKLEGSFTRMPEVIGKIALTDIVPDREIKEAEVTTKDQWFKPEEREIGITFEKFTDLVGGSARPGDVVDIMVSYNLEQTGDVPAPPVMVAENVELKNVFDEGNISYENSKDKNAFKPISILIKVNNELDAALDMAKKKGRLYLKRHGNVIKNVEDKKMNEDKVIIRSGN